MVIRGRTYADGQPQDYKAVNALQAKYSIVPLAKNPSVLDGSWAQPAIIKVS